MNSPDAAAELAALLYAAVHDGNPGDVDFYRAACRDAGRVLELGCGAGRVAAAIAADGVAVTGLDNDEGALALARARGLDCVAGTMAEFSLDTRFDRIIIPYNGLFCLPDEAALLSCLRCIAAHLRSDGLCVFDGYAVDIAPDAATSAPLPTAPEHVAAVTVAGAAWDVYEESVLLPATQQVDARYRHVRRHDLHEVTLRILQRYLYAEELPDLLARAGLVIVAVHGGFAGEPFTDTSERFVVRAVPV